MIDFFDDPGFVRDLLGFVRELEIPFALAQIEEGADIIGVGDAASSLIGPELFAEHMVEHHRAYVEAIHCAGAKARLHICGNIAALLPAIGGLGYDLVDIDSLVSIAEARRGLGPDAVLAGNLDPVRMVRNAGPEEVMAAVRLCRRESASRAFVVGAGCEIPRDSPQANVQALRVAAEELWD